MTLPALCICKSGIPYQACCQRYHQGLSAPDPEALMRSRYSAYALMLADYLQVTWHPSTRPQPLTLNPETRWKHLEILDSGASGEQGRVHFRATFMEDQRWAVLEERSRFSLADGRWLYLDGVTEVQGLKPGRNDSCPCGSGRKLKKCC